MKFTVPVRVQFVKSSIKPRVYTTLDQWRSEHPLLLIHPRRFQQQWHFCQTLLVADLKLHRTHNHTPETHTKHTCGIHKGQMHVIAAHWNTHEQWLFDPKTYEYSLPPPLTGASDAINHHPTESSRIVTGPTPTHAWSTQAGVAGLYHHIQLWAQGDRLHHWSHAAQWDWYSTQRDFQAADQHLRVNFNAAYHLFGWPLSQRQWQQWNGDLYLKSLEEQMHFKLKYSHCELPPGIAVVELMQ